MKPKNEENNENKEEYSQIIGKLFVIFPNQKTINFPLFYGLNTIGRSRKFNSIVFYSDKISLKHSIIEISEELVCWLSDCGTINKTRLFLSSPNKIQSNGYFLEPHFKVFFFFYFVIIFF